MYNIAVVGAGAFGTSLAMYCKGLGYNVKVWCFEKDLPAIVAEKGENTVYLPGYTFPKSVKFVNDPEEAVKEADLVLFVPPSAHLRQTAGLFKNIITDKQLILTATKGIEHGTCMLMSQIMEEVFPEYVSNMAFLSGPSFAKDVAAGYPTDLSCASFNMEVAHKIQKMLHSSIIRIYTNDDVVGVELGGSVKNVLAIACGVSDGLGLGLSARAALMTRGLAEITRLGSAMGANPLTFQGLSGVGDLILTCTGDLSRNRTLGKKLAEGKTAEEIVNSQKSVAEGYVTAKPVVELAKRHNIEMPISEAVYKVCYEGADLKKSVMKLMNRSEKDEFEGINSPISEE
ncbi:MAG: NAD(P)-dependent glycerol-3-phosphate dehydrogenase [Spirochaetes bacterium]|jgi:glycerol-3-phosphate dehydrogenase (NAD(P)+)|nr:NAD(P)-dependent glycerol-3-phosphate dehydrogenase [Spirochaetota bacterium]